MPELLPLLPQAAIPRTRAAEATARMMRFKACSPWLPRESRQYSPTATRWPAWC